MADHNVQLERFQTLFPGQFGVPGSDVSAGIRTGGGNVYWVGDPDATYYDAADAHDGTDPHYPKATIQGGLDACVSGNGDMVVVMADSYVITESLTMTLDRVRLFSWDYLRGQPAPSVVIQADPTTFDLLTINADQIEVAGFKFEHGGSGTDNCIAVGTTGAAEACFIHDCRFEVGVYGVEIGSALGTVNDITVSDSTFIQVDATAGNAGVYVAYAIRAMIKDNFFYSAQAGTYGVSFRNAACAGTMIRNNDIVIVEAGGVAILRGAAVTAAFHGNRVSGGPTTASAISQQVDGGIYAVSNWVSDGTGGAQIDAT